MRNIASRTRLSALLVAFCALALGLPVLASAATTPQVLVRFARGTTSATQTRLLTDAGLTRVRTIPHIGVAVGRVRAGTAAATAEKSLDAAKQVLYAEREGRARAAATPSDPSYAAVSWTYTVPNIPGALDIGLGSATVYVLDSGVDLTHPDLAGATLTGYNTFAPGTDPADDNGHGTKVAGTIAARANNSIGGAGVCPGCKVVPVKVLDSTGTGPWSNVAAGLVWASDQGARIVNLSLNNTASSQTLEDAIAYAVGKGVLVIAAGGNDSSSTPSYPASLPGVLGVAGSDWNDRVYNGSNFGPWLKLAASGCYETTQSGGGYTNACGTSIAAPIVAGVAGLMLSHNGTLTATQLENGLAQTAHPISERTDGTTNLACPAGGCVSYGRVDAAAAVASVGPVPSAAGPPSLNGTAKVGQALSASTGAWDNDPTGYAYDFRRCDADGTSNCSSVQNGSQSSYTPVAADYGKTIVVRVTAANAAGAASATSAARAIGADAPTIAGVDLSGSTLVNQLLTTGTVAASFGGTTPIAVVYSWRRCDSAGANCTAIAGQSGPSYTVALADLGATIRVRVSASNVSGSGDFDSGQSAVVTAVAVAPSFGSSAPTLSGTVAVGQTLTASQPTAGGSWPIAYTGAWTRCDSSGANCAATGVTSPTYTLAAADAGATLRYTLTAANGAGTTTATALSAAVPAAAAAAATAPSFASLTPTLTGTPTVGQTLTASQPTATGTAPIAYTGAWTRCDATGASCAAIGVTTATYTLATADVGKTLRYTLTATNSAGTATTGALSAVVTAATTGTTTDATAKPDLSIVIQGPATATVGTSAHFTFTVRGRQGTGTASAATLGVTVPAELAVDKTQSSGTADCTTKGQSVSCNVGSVAPGDDGVVELWASVKEVGDGLVTMKATVASAGADANLADNLEETALRLTGAATTTPTTPTTPAKPTTPPATSGGGGTSKKPKPTPTPTGPQPAVAAVPAQASKDGRVLAQLPLTATLTRTGLPKGAAVRYRWQVLLPGGSWVAIAGAAGPTYTPDASYAGSRLRVVAKSAGKTVASPPTPPLQPALQVSSQRTVQVGSTLRAKVATAVAGKGARVRYQWQALSAGRWVPLAGATKATFKADSRAAGKNLRVVARVGKRVVASQPTTPVRRASKR